jgi:uncharacterized membrane protein
MSPVALWLPVDFGWPHLVAMMLIFGLWGLYTPILKFFGRGSLNSQLHVVRARWMHVHQDVARQDRLIDAILLGHISGSISYFGSATLLILAGLVGTLANINHLYIVTRDVKFLAEMTADLFALEFALITLILIFSLFAFTYALRKMAYTFALLGGLEQTEANTPEAEVMGEQTARVLTEAVRSINSGIRGFYYAIAALFLFAGPYICIAATLLITALLYYRQIFSPTAVAIGKYVEALKSLEAKEK